MTKKLQSRQIPKYGLELGIDTRKMHRIIEFDQKAWLKLYIEINTDLKKKAKNDFEFFKVMNNYVFGKTIKNVRNLRDIKFVATFKRRNKFVSKPNYPTMKILLAQLQVANKSENLLNQIRQIVYSFYQDNRSRKRYTII